MANVRECVRCGCTDLRACRGGCSWASLDPPVCTACTDKLAVGDPLLDDDDMLDGDEPPIGGGTLVCAHQPLYVDESSGYCVRCGEAFHE